MSQKEYSVFSLSRGDAEDTGVQLTTFAEQGFRFVAWSDEKWFKENDTRETRDAIFIREKVAS